MSKSGLPCYRNGGCGPYEMLSCTECPASKSDYLQCELEPKPLTNADRIRAMTDEELAEFIGGIFTIEFDPWGYYDPRTVVTQEPRVELRSMEDALDWLKQEAQ